MGLFSGNFWKSGVGGALRGGLGIITGGASEIADQVVGIGKGLINGGGKSPKVNHQNYLPQQRVNPNGQPNYAGPPAGIQEPKKSLTDKLMDFYEENKALTIGGGAVSLLGLWQMMTPKRKRLKIFR